MDVDGSNKTNITNTREVYESGIDFSPDGSQMCLSRGQLPFVSGYVMNVDADQLAWRGVCLVP
jgi:hypothetical protein